MLCVCMSNAVGWVYASPKFTYGRWGPWGEVQVRKGSPHDGIRAVGKTPETPFLHEGTQEQGKGPHPTPTLLGPGS